MPHLHRFFLPVSLAAGDAIALPEAEAHHALRVARIRTGETIELFDGQGNAARATLEQAGKREASAVITEVLPPQARAPEFTLLMAWLHKDAAIEEVLRRGTEIGITRFAFFKAARSEQSPRLTAKHERLCIEACKQCGRNWLPEWGIAADAGEVVRQHAPGAYVAALTAEATPVDAAPHVPRLLAIGPEGDFTADELSALLSAGALPLSLGAYVYRSEAAALLGASLLLHRAGAFSPAPCQ